MKTKTAYLREENLLTLLSQNNFIVPEIQREYVWGNNKTVIVTFLKELKKKVGDICETCHQPHSNEKINIGFLYSYKPDYVKVKQERFLDENLVDGQQRFTTLFLLLFCCALKEDKKRNFLALIRFEEDLSMSFDFKVRDLTRRFLLEFVNKTDSIAQIQDIEKQIWFLTDYKQDVSINAMIKALKYILNEFMHESKYYEHFLTNVVFWHFKTEVTSQGEELYITMNARGEELADNEITKAALMLEEEELVDSGQRWEDWQQFFWKHRDKDSSFQSADAGFNGFLKCIAGFEYYSLSAHGQKPEKELRQLLDTEKVEIYFESLKYLEDHKEDFKEEYPNYIDWVDEAIGIIWLFLNGNDTNWFTDYTDENKGTERSRMVFIWSVLSYILTCKEENKLNVFNTFRFLRLHYIKFNNYDRSVVGILDNVRSALVYGPWLSHGTEEEIKKHQYLKGLDEEKQKDVEQVIWQIEDYRLNLNGRDLSAVNISHLIDFGKNPSLEELMNRRDAFNTLFPSNATKGSNILRSTLLFKGSFWKDISTGYYSRYDFSDWRRHIRKPEFIIFFNEYMNHNNDLSVILTHSIHQFIKEKEDDIENAVETLPEPSLHDRLKYYSILIDPDKFWSEGDKVAIRHDVPIEEIRLFENENRIFYNSKGTFHGNSGNTDLWKMAVILHKNPLQHLKDLI